VCMVAYTSYMTDGRVRLEAETLAEWGYEVYFLALKNGRQPITFTVSGVTVMELNVAKYRGKSKLQYLFSYLRFLISAFASCTLLFFKRNIDIIHVHNMPDVLVFSALIPKLFGCKLILDIHDSVPETYAGKFEADSVLLFRALALEERLCCAFADRIICVNHVQRDTILGRGIPARKVCTVVTMPHFDRSRTQRLSVSSQHFRVVNHGTVSKRLGIDLVVRAAPVLAREIPGFELHIIGDGDDHDEIVRLSDDLGLSKCIAFHRRVPWDTLPDVLSRMDIGIVGNRVSIATELMLPSKLIDYVMLGIPAVVPKLKTIEYYFTPDMVSYFEPEDVESIAAAVLTLYRDANRRQAQPANARKFVETYEWNKNRDFRELYGGLIDACLGVKKFADRAESFPDV
jgi:glycosyltransferase involved in cell wall biosynthesis